MESTVTVSSGDTSFQAIVNMGKAAQEAIDLRVQVNKLHVDRTRMEIELKSLQRERRALKGALLAAERSNPLNENDERMLIQHGVTLRFRCKFTGGAEIKASRNGREITVARGSESATLLPQVLRRVRAKLRES